MTARLTSAPTRPPLAGRRARRRPRPPPPPAAATATPPTTTPPRTDGADDHRRADDDRPRRPRRPTTRPPPTTDGGDRPPRPAPIVPGCRSPACRSTDGQVAADRPALVVKIDNDPRGPPADRPQRGRHRVRGDRRGRLTRFAAVFHSQDAEPGRPDPLRPHARTSTCSARCNQPLFAWSGGNAGVTRAIGDSRPHRRSAAARQRRGGYRRSAQPRRAAQPVRQHRRAAGR